MLSDKLCQPINGIMKPNRATSPLRWVVDMFMKNIGKQEAVVSFYIYKNLNRKEWSYEGITSKIGKAH